MSDGDGHERAAGQYDPRDTGLVLWHNVRLRRRREMRQEAMPWWEQAQADLQAAKVNKVLRGFLHG